MKRTSLMLGTMILGLGMAGAAWAQPAPNHDRDARVNSGYTGYGYTGRGDRDDQQNAWRGDRDDQQNAWRGDRDDQQNAWRGDRDGDDNYRGWNARGDRDDQQNTWRGERNGRDSWNWGRSTVRHNQRNGW